MSIVTTDLAQKSRPKTVPRTPEEDGHYARSPPLVSPEWPLLDDHEKARRSPRESDDF